MPSCKLLVHEGTAASVGAVPGEVIFPERPVLVLNSLTYPASSESRLLTHDPSQAASLSLALAPTPGFPCEFGYAGSSTPFADARSVAESIVMGAPTGASGVVRRYAVESGEVTVSLLSPLGVIPVSPPDHWSAFGLKP